MEEALKGIVGITFIAFLFIDSFPPTDATPAEAIHEGQARRP